MGKYRSLGSFLDRVFRNNLNANFDDVDTDIQAQKKRVDDLILANPSPSEVQDARLGFPVLRDKLVDVDAQLADNATQLKKTDGVKVITEKEFTDLCSKDGNGVVTDWQPAIQYAFNTYNFVRFPNGTYTCNSPVVVTNPNYLHVEGKGLAILIFPTTSGINISTNIIVNFDNLQIVGLNAIPASDTTTGLDLSCNRYSTFTMLKIRGFGKGINFQSNKFTLKFDSCLIEKCRTGIVMQNANNNMAFLNCTIENNLVGVDMCVSSAGNSTTYNNQFLGGAIQFNTNYGIRARKAEHLQVQSYFEANGTAHIDLEASMANITSYFYGGSTPMAYGVNLVTSYITLDGRSWNHSSYLINKDAASIVRSTLRHTETSLANILTAIIEETLDSSLKRKWNFSELIDGQWYRTDSLAKIRINSSGSIQLYTGGEAIDFVDATLWSYAGKKVRYQSAAPTTGTYAVGDKVWNTAPTAGGKMGWVCVTAGTPGTWKAFGAIDA